ncbi:MAG: hypothetical protein ACRD6X_17000 [Pyrinomonadaceae bacterium]
MLDAVDTELTIPLFNKLAPGRWEFLGLWSVLDGRYIFDEKQNRMLWKFTLQKQTGTQETGTQQTGTQQTGTQASLLARKS